MDFIDTSTLTEQDKFLFMCLQRIEKLESEVDRLNLKSRYTLIRDISCVHSTTGLGIDMLAYFLNVPPQIRAVNNVQKMLLEVLRVYKHNWSPRLTELSKHVPLLTKIWEITEDDFNEWGNLLSGSFSDNMYAFLEALTDDELEGYWNTFRLVWTKWKTQ